MPHLYFIATFSDFYLVSSCSTGILQVEVKIFTKNNFFLIRTKTGYRFSFFHKPVPCKWWPHEQISLALSLTSLEIWFINKTVWQSLEVSQRNSCYPSNQYSGFFRLSWPACRSWCLGEHLWAFFCLSYSSNIFSNSLWGNAWPMYFCLCFLVLVNCLEDNYVSGESDKVHLSQCLVLHAAQYSCFYFITMPLSQSIIRGLFTRSCSQFQLNSK